MVIIVNCRIVYVWQHLNISSTGYHIFHRFGGLHFFHEFVSFSGFSRCILSWQAWCVIWLVRVVALRLVQYSHFSVFLCNFDLILNCSILKFTFVFKWRCIIQIILNCSKYWNKITLLCVRFLVRLFQWKLSIRWRKSERNASVLFSGKFRAVTDCFVVFIFGL